MMKQTKLFPPSYLTFGILQVPPLPPSPPLPILFIYLFYKMKDLDPQFSVLVGKNALEGVECGGNKGDKLLVVEIVVPIVVVFLALVIGVFLFHSSK
jgi:hypothetical protein